MKLSNSGRVVLVDDNKGEIKPVMDMLGKECVPYIYFDGSVENLPQSPLGGVRFVFLDIELEGMNGQSEKNMASQLVQILLKIVSPDNGPYMILFWSRHGEIIELVLENCTAASINPIAYVDMDKSECLDGDIGILTGKLRDKLSQVGAFQLYVEWENMLNESCKQFVKDFSSLVNPGEKWSFDTGKVFNCLF